MGIQQSITKDYNYGKVEIKGMNAIKQVTSSSSREKQTLIKLYRRQSVEVLHIQEMAQPFCGNPNQFYVTLRYHGETLFDLIEARRQAGSIFKESEIVLYISKICDNIIPTKVQMSPREILLPDCKFCDPSIFWNMDDTTRVNRNIVSMEYVAPDKSLTQQSQIYSLGLIMIEMATLKSPLAFDNLENYHAQIQQCPELSMIFKGLITSMLDKDPYLRPTVDGIKESLDGIIEFASARNLRIQSKKKENDKVETQPRTVRDCPLLDLTQINRSENSYQYNSRRTQDKQSLKVASVQINQQSMAKEQTSPQPEVLEFESVAVSPKFNEHSHKFKSLCPSPTRSVLKTSMHKSRPISQHSKKRAWK